MVGVVLLVAAFVLFVPVFLTSMAAVAAALGMSLTTDAEQRHEGSELIQLNR
jgi:hypothetical protein